MECELPDELIASVGEFDAIFPIWSDYVGWRREGLKLAELLHVGAVPLFLMYTKTCTGLDFTSVGEVPAVYFLDKDGLAPRRSGVGGRLLLLADNDRAHAEHWPSKWQLNIDPDIDRSPRAAAIWRAG